MKNLKIAHRLPKNFWQSQRAGGQKEKGSGGNAGRDYSKSASGFCPKKVLISSKIQKVIIGGESGI